MCCLYDIGGNDYVYEKGHHASVRYSNDGTVAIFCYDTIAGPPPQSNSVEHVHPSSTEYVKDKVLVWFKPEAVKDEMVVPDIAAAIHSKVGATVVAEFNWLPGLQLVNLPEGHGARCCCNIQAGPKCPLR